MMEFIEMLKCDEKFLYNLLTLSQEQNIKTGRFAMIYADEVIVSHTNETNTTPSWQQALRSAARPHHPDQGSLQPARLGRDSRSMTKLLRQGTLNNVHIAPNTLYAASLSPSSVASSRPRRQA